MQLDLLDWQLPRRVLLFPLDRRTAKVRHTATLLASKHGDDAVLYWRQVVANIKKHLDRIGLSEVEADAELRRFHDAVQAEMIRMTHRGRRPGGGDAA